MVYVYFFQKWKKKLDCFGQSHFKPDIKNSVLSTGPFLRDICGLSSKLLEKLYFQCIFTYFQKQWSETNLNSKNFSNTFETLLENISECTLIKKVLPYMRGMEVVLVFCIHLTLFISSHVTPCILWALVHKFINIWAFFEEIFTKWYWLSFNLWFSMYLQYLYNKGCKDG